MGASDTRAEFEIDVGVTGGDEAEDTAAKLERLRANIRGNSTALQEMEAAYGRLRGAASVKQFESLTRAIQVEEKSVQKHLGSLEALRAKMVRLQADGGTGARGIKSLQAQIDKA